MQTDEKVQYQKIRPSVLQSGEGVFCVCIYCNRLHLADSGCKS